jgi:hypothetical protein
VNRLPLITMFLLICTSLPASGAVIIQVESKTISAGDLSAYVDVWITGERGETLEEFGYTFQISGATAQSGDLQFAELQSDSEVSVNGPIPYLFFGDSGAFNAERLGGNPVLLTGGDILASEQDRAVDGTFLLARLELQHIGSLSTPSHEFTISLVPADTFFEIDVDATAEELLNFTHFAGTITVSAAAVPEPTTFGALALIAVAYAGRCAHRGKRNAADSDEQSQES